MMKRGFMDVIPKLKPNRYNRRPQIHLIQKKCLQVRLNIKAMLIVFFNFFGLVHYEFCTSASQTINQVFYKQVLVQLREKVHRKRPKVWKSKSQLLHYDNMPALSVLFIREFLVFKNIPVVPTPTIFP